MCSATGVGVASALTGFYGRQQQISAQHASSHVTEQSYKLQARIEANNAKIAEANADVAIERSKLRQAEGLREVRHWNLEIDRLSGQQKAGFGSSGVTMEGTPTDVLMDTARYGIAGDLSIRRQTAIGVWADKTEAANFLRQAENFKTQSSIYRKYARSIKEGRSSQGSAALIGNISSTLFSIAPYVTS